VTEAREQDKWVLKRVSNSSSWAECAVSDQREEIEALQRLYSSLMGRLLEGTEVNGIVEMWSKMVEARKGLAKNWNGSSIGFGSQGCAVFTRLNRQGIVAPIHVVSQPTSDG
jgi:hypothetical protein